MLNAYLVRAYGRAGPGDEGMMPFTWEEIERNERRAHKIMLESLEFDIAGAYERYAEDIRRHVDKLTNEAKKQAVLNAVLKQTKRRKRARCACEFWGGA